MDRLVLEYECPILNIGQQKGDWGYIDFIREREMGQAAVMKGQDCIGRAFLVIKAEYVLAEGDPIHVFATLYQKYVNNKNIWQCFNYPGMELLKTSYIGEGYAVDEKQIALLTDLLRDQCIPMMEGLYRESPFVSLRLRSHRRGSF
jgi:hypothetical protein